MYISPQRWKAEAMPTFVLARAEDNTITPDEAKSKLCALWAAHYAVLTVQGGGGPVNRIVPPMCMADRCMAWRWHSSTEEAAGYTATKRGFCGWANSP